MKIERRYIVDEHDRRVAVQLDIGTFGKIEEILENHGLAQFMLDDKEDEVLDFEQAKNYYRTLTEANCSQSWR